jgi:hypothetical protein
MLCLLQVVVGPRPRGAGVGEVRVAETNTQHGAGVVMHAVNEDSLMVR